MILQKCISIVKKFLPSGFKRDVHNMKWKFHNDFYFDDYGTPIRVAKPIRIEDIKYSHGKRKSSGVAEMSLCQAGMEE
jgi:hypothetical protein